ncbi:MAG TPA: hypothetical protein VF653_11105, partial [Methylomirabilota bacterium]
MSEPRYWGLFREREHSPGRESDDAEILRLTAKQLESRGAQVELKAPEVLGAGDTPPDGVFLMCERMEALRILLGWQERGVRQVNAPLAVLNTYRDRMIAQLREANVPFIDSHLVSTRGGEAGVRGPMWVKRPDVHNTQEGDVVFADGEGAVGAALAGLAARGMSRAVLQPHVPGDLIKFYGVRGEGKSVAANWFEWFYHRDQGMLGYAFDPSRLRKEAFGAAAALELEVFGGDAVIRDNGEPTIVDINAWPSYARFRERAAEAIAEHLV